MTMVKKGEERERERVLKQTKSGFNLKRFISEKTKNYNTQQLWVVDVGLNVLVPVGWVNDRIRE